MCACLTKRSWVKTPGSRHPGSRPLGEDIEGSVRNANIREATFAWQDLARVMREKAEVKVRSAPKKA